MDHTLQTLNMCDFCIHDQARCGAQPALSRQVTLHNGFRLATLDAVVACDKYESPVELLKSKFH